MSYELFHSGALVTKAKKALIILHGRGGSAKAILQLAETLCDETFYIAAPQAPNNTWYPYSFMEDESRNEPWLSSSVENVKSVIDTVAQHILKEKIFILGFSQGACLTLEVATRFANKYGGVIAFTGGLIGHTINEKKYHGNFQGTKVFIGNSDNDPHVPLVRSEESKKIMEKLGAIVTLKIYKGMAHTINEDELAHARNILHG